ncbi:MAG: hypothetical protein R6U11_02035, partial [Bacteroidales bacterium]
MDVDNVPLKEVLDFMSRNYGIDFYLGENIIWVTKLQPDKSGGPLETRIYELNRGVQLHGSDWSRDEEANPSDIGLLSSKATVLSDGESYLKEIIEKFVPEVEGAQFHLDLNSHTVFARNSPDNLKLIGEILE